MAVAECQRAVAAAAEERTGGGGAQSLALVWAAGSGGAAQQTITLPTGTWFLFSCWGQVVQSARPRPYVVTVSYAAVTPVQTITTADWARVLATNCLPSANCRVYLAETMASGAGDECRFDDVSVKPLALASLFATRDAGAADVTVQAAITRTAYTQAGLALSLDNAASPANFVIAYLDGTGKVNRAGALRERQSGQRDTFRVVGVGCAL